jgi:predicted nuclease of predicted toxin-antitoxin system
VKVLLDENIDWRLSRELPDHQVDSVPLIGWSGLKNGDLLAKAEKQYDALITMDSNMRHQQNLQKFQIAIIVLQAPSNRLADTRPLMARVLTVLPTAKPGTITVIQ